MRQPSLLEEGDDPREEDRRRIALHDRHIRDEVLRDLAQAVHAGVSHVVEGLARLHEVEVVVGRQSEDVQHLVDHLGVLAGEREPVDAPPPLDQRTDDRRHLDRLGTRADHREDSGPGGDSVRGPHYPSPTPRPRPPSPRSRRIASSSSWTDAIISPSIPAAKHSTPTVTRSTTR